MKNNKKSELIKYEIFNDVIGLPWETVKFEGLSRDAKLFRLLKSASEKKINEIEIFKEDDDKYKLVGKNVNGDKINLTKFVTSQSTSPMLSDIFLLDEETQKLFNPNLKRKEFSKKFYNDVKKINIEKSVSNYKKFFIDHDFNNDEVLSLISYWKEFNNSPNPYLNINSRITTIIGDYLNNKGEKNAITDYQLNKQKILLKDWGTDYKELITLINNNISLFINKESIDSKIKVKKNDDIKLLLKKLSSNHILKLKISDILSLVKNNALFIPTFQRDFVWSAKKCVRFLNSILKKYPIGILIFANTNLSLGNKNVVFTNINNVTIQNNHNFLVIDGQQRLTTLALIIFMSDLKLKMNIMENEEWTSLNKHLKEIANIRFYKEKFYLKKELENKLSEKYKNKRTGKLYNVDDYSLSINDINSLEKINHTEIPIITTEEIDENDLGKIIDIFENINVSSTKLTHIDLIHASLSTHENGKYDFRSKLKKMMKTNKISSFNLREKEVVLVWKLIYDIEYSDGKIQLNEKDILRTVLNKKNHKKWVSLIKKIEELLEKSIKFLDKELGFTMLNRIPNIAFLLNICAYFIYLENNEKKHDKHNTKQDILLRLLLRTINKDYSSGTSNKIAADVRRIFHNTNNLNDDLEFENSHEKIKIAIKESSYDKSGQPAYKIIIGLLRTLKPISLINCENNVITSDTRWEKINDNMHHFVPKKNKELKFDTKELNKISNIFIIQDTENKKEIKTDTPFDYLLKDIKNKSEHIYYESIKKLSKAHLITVNDIKSIINSKNKDINEKQDIIKTMWENRSELIYKKIIEKYEKGNA